MWDSRGPRKTILHEKCQSVRAFVRNIKRSYLKRLWMQTIRKRSDIYRHDEFKTNIILLALFLQYSNTCFVFEDSLKSLITHSSYFRYFFVLFACVFVCLFNLITFYSLTILRKKTATKQTKLKIIIQIE